MSSYLLIKNTLNESCVCSGIRINFGNRYNYKSCFDVGNFEIINQIAGNITSINNLLNCKFSAIGSPAIVIMSVEFENNQYDLFYTEGNDDLCCRINSCFEIGPTEKNILFNKCLWKKLDLDSSGFCYFLLMYFGFTSYNHAPYNEAPLYHTAKFIDLVENFLTINGVYVIEKNVINMDIQTIEGLNITKSTVHRISFYESSGLVSVISPIIWRATPDIQRSDDGIYKRYYGTQSTSKIQFSLKGLCSLYKRKFFEKCESLNIPVKLISGDEYEFLGNLNLPTTEEEVTAEDWFDPDFKLWEW